MHCHMSHHVMNQTGHKFPNMIGVRAGALDAQLQSLLPGYMTLGHDGMAEHGRHIERGHARVPPNSIPMRGGAGPFDYITMGGLVTLLKVREDLERYDRDPGWYRYPEATLARIASSEELRRDGIVV
jgi:manganese oxidase